MDYMEHWDDRIQQLLDKGKYWLLHIPPTELYASIAVLLFTIILILSVGVFRKKRRDTIVLTGLSGSGKTVLFYQLRDGSAHQGTVTSMDPNEGTFVPHSEASEKGKRKAIHVVDFPGHSRLRPKLDEFLPHAAGVVFVVDALDFLSNCRAAAEYLYDILTNGAVMERRVPVLVFCNKTEKVTADTKEFIKRQLEKEIEKMRVTREDFEATLGVAGYMFTLEQCYNKVTVGDGSGLKGDISQLEMFIRGQVKA